MTAKELDAPVMDYEEAGKLAYAEDEVIIFYADPTMDKYAAHPDGHYVRLSRPVEPKAQVESASVEVKPICECGHGENQHWPETQDKYKLRRCSDLGCDCELYEPKEVESGDGLPPMDVTEEEWNEDDATPPGKQIGHLLCRERQLKASLLREKALKKLLREVIENPYITHHMKERIDAAVTGE